jgi:hypothetical protein
VIVSPLPFLLPPPLTPPSDFDFESPENGFEKWPQQDLRRLLHGLRKWKGEGEGRECVLIGKGRQDAGMTKVCYESYIYIYYIYI